METAREWKQAPWEVTGEKLTRWRRLVWLERRKLYSEQANEKIRRQQQELELKRLQSG